MAILKKIMLIGIFLQIATAQADNMNEYQYVIQYHNIKGDENFQKILSEPLYYNIKNDVPSYKDTTLQKNRNYVRLHTTHIDEDRQLFYGKNEFDVVIQGKQKHLTSYSYFLLDKKEGTIKGGEIAPGSYEANFIGINQKIHTWPRS